MVGRIISLSLCFAFSSCGSKSNLESKRETPTLNYTATKLDGNISLKGQLIFGKRVGVDTKIEIGYLKGTQLAAYSALEALTKTMPASFESLKFEITNLDAGDYTFWARVDDNDDDAYGSGDLVGYYSSENNATNDFLDASLFTLTQDTRSIEILLRAF